MLNKGQDQSTGDNSTALQSGGSMTVHIGLSYGDVRDAALDVFRANFHELSLPAMNLAKQRAEEITNEFLEELRKRNPEGIKKSVDPDFQASLFTIQQEYAKTGDRELGDLLVDILVDRSKEEGRTLAQIVLTESLSTAPKLTSSQIATLTVAFIFKNTVSHGIASWDALGIYLDAHIRPWIESVSTTNASYQHLQFTSCATVNFGATLAGALFENYPGLFESGFDEDALKGRNINLPIKHPAFTKCLNAPELYQISTISDHVLEQQAEQWHDVTPAVLDQLKQLRKEFKLILLPFKKQQLIRALFSNE